MVKNGEEREKGEQENVGPEVLVVGAVLEHTRGQGLDRSRRLRHGRSPSPARRTSASGRLRIEEMEPVQVEDKATVPLSILDRSFGRHPWRSVGVRRAGSGRASPTPRFSTIEDPRRRVADQPGGRRRPSARGDVLRAETEEDRRPLCAATASRKGGGTAM